jgi:hypothetical protein
MSGQVIISHAFVEKWASTCEMVSAIYGKSEVEKRCASLPTSFRSELIAELKERRRDERLG